MTDPAPKQTQCHCNKCLNTTKHFVVTTHSRTETDDSDADEFGGISWGDVFSVLECCGCGTLAVRHTSWFSEADPGDERVQYYPPRTARREPPWADQLSAELGELLAETYGALHDGSLRLAMMGARALIDSVILSTVGDVGTFQQKLQALERDGHLARVNRLVLEAALEVGNAAAHQGYKAGPDAANLVMDIVENLLQQQVLTPAAKRLRRQTPRRKRRP